MHWTQHLAVLRWSFALTAFFLVHALLLLGPSAKRGSSRYLLHYGFWCARERWGVADASTRPLKAILFAVLVVASFSIPADFFPVFGDM